LFFAESRKMKKISLMVMSFFMVTSVAKAENVYVPYVGADILYNQAKTKFANPKSLGAFVNVGTTYNKYFGTEIFYGQTPNHSTKTKSNDRYKTSYRAYGVDAIVSVPVHEKADLTAGVGLASYVFGEKIKGAQHTSDEGIGYRFSVGAVYRLSEHLAFRANARYVKLNHISNLKRVSEYTVGARYYFTKE